MSMGQSRGDAIEDGNANKPPTAYFTELTFSDGSTLPLEPNDIVVLVGPNNSGKSAALRELPMLLTGEKSLKRVLVSAKWERTGTTEELKNYLAQNASKQREGTGMRYLGLGFSLSDSHLQSTFSNMGNMLPFFFAAMGTSNRITYCDERDNIDYVNSAPEHPIHVLFTNDKTANRISGYFQRAFKTELFPFHGRARIACLMVGKKPPVEPGEDRLNDTYIEKVRASCRPLQGEGDGMRSFAAVTLGLLTTRSQSILTLDEPEAFLHPPQARLLGEFIVRERPPNSQLFIATHNIDVLQGLLSSSSKNIRIVRIVRRGDVNHIRELSKREVEEIGSDSLMQYSGVLNGMFHERAILCEGDADCLLYQSLLSLPAVRGDSEPDVVFVHCAGKARLSKLVRALRNLGVRSDVIVDIDVLQEGLKSLVDAAGADGKAITGPGASVKAAIEQERRKTQAANVKTDINALLADLGDGELPDEIAKKITQAVKTVSPWEKIKTGGKAAIPGGQVSQQYETLEKLCRQSGIWIVPAGTLERWKKTVGGHGPLWAQEVVSAPDFATDPELEPAREFIRTLWHRSEE
ncbi:MAG: AAA family ATPase [Rhodospirillales bacterium]|nr:AAA family ATPase [Rhodospirillales bacterium]